MEHRQLGLAPEGADRLQERRDRLRHARHVVLGEREVGVHAPEDAVEEVDLPGALEEPRELEAFLEIDAVLDVLLDNVADADEEIVANRFADGFMDHQPEPRAVLGRAAERVGALVGARREELADEMPARHRLDAVEPALLAAQGRRGIVGDDAVDVVTVHLPREVAMAGLAHAGRRQRRSQFHDVLKSARRPRCEIWHMIAAPWPWMRSENCRRYGMMRSLATSIWPPPQLESGDTIDEPPNMVRARPPLAFSS